MRIFYYEWLGKENIKQYISIDLNVWVIGAFIAGIFVGVYLI